MSLKEYITTAQLTYLPIKRVINMNGGDATIMQPYVDRANDWYEDFAETKGVLDPTLLDLPKTPLMAIEVLNYYAAWKYASENGGGNSTNHSPDDAYTILEENAFMYLNKFKDGLSYEYMTGNVTSKTDRAYSLGKAVRA